MEVGEAGTDPAPEGTLRVPFARILKGGSEPTREPSCSLFGNRPTRQSRAPLRIRNRYCQFPSYFVFLCARAKSVLATQRKLAERFAVHLVELFDRHWRSQVRTESFDKVGKESLRELSTHSQDGFCASAKKRGLTRKMDSTGSGPKRRQPRPGKGEEEGEGKNGPTPQKAVLCETIL